MRTEGVILTCFAGRRANMELLLAYTDELHSQGLLEEMHIWDFSKNNADQEWLDDNFEKAPFISTPDQKYVNTDATLEPQGILELKFKCDSNAHLILADENNNETEIALGAYGNAWNFIRDGRQGDTLAGCTGGTCNRNEWKDLKITITQGEIKAETEDIFMIADIRPPKSPLKVKLAGWNGSPVSWKLPIKPQKNGRHSYASLFKPLNKKSWREYYSHYTEKIYPDKVIIKCDDDILFIDVESFADFIQRRREDRESLIIMPSIVNNELCAHHQYLMGLIPEHVGKFNKLPPKYGGTLWSSGKLAKKLHEHFVQNHQEWILNSKMSNTDIKIPIGQRVSINFFAILSEDLPIYSLILGDDEHDITVKATKITGRNNSINMRTTVSHLSYFKQRDTGFNDGEIREMYKSLKEFGRIDEKCKSAPHVKVSFLYPP